MSDALSCCAIIIKIKNLYTEIVLENNYLNRFPYKYVKIQNTEADRIHRTYGSMNKVF